MNFTQGLGTALGIKSGKLKYGGGGGGLFGGTGFFDDPTAAINHSMDTWTGGRSSGRNQVERFFDPLSIAGNSTGGKLENVIDPFSLVHDRHPAVTETAQTTIQPPNRASATTAALGEQNRMWERRRASQTLFTGGQGVLDQPSTASSYLLGV